MEYQNNSNVARVSLAVGDAGNTARDAAAQRAREQGADKMQPTGRSVGEPMSIVHGGAQAPDGSFRRHENDAAPHSDGKTNVLDTARRGSMPVADDLRPTDTIDVGHGIRTTVQAALNAGLIRKEGARYVVAGNGTATASQTQDTSRQPNQQQQTQQDAGADRLADLPAEAHAIAQEFTSGKINNVSLREGTRSMMETGALTEDQAARAAQDLGITPEEAKQRASTLHSAFTAQAHEMVGALAPTIFEWARSRNPALLRDAVNAHVHENATDAYNDVIREFWRDTARTNPKAILNATNAAEIQPRMEPNGVLSIVVNGTRTSFTAALNSGLIGPKPRGRR